MIQIFDGDIPEFNKEKYVHFTAVVIGRVFCKKCVSIWPNAVVRGDDNRISIGEFSNIQDGSVLHITEEKSLTIGDYVTVGHNCNLHACKIGDYSIIGIGSIVLDGAVIGKNCVIAAGSVVPPNKKIPDNTLFLKGEFKPIDEDKIAEKKHHAEYYWDLAKKYIKTASVL
jgi:gamma-carbonic anhydrase